MRNACTESASASADEDYKGMLAQPAEPKFKGVLLQVYVRGAPYGGGVLHAEATVN